MTRSPRNSGIECGVRGPIYSLKNTRPWLTIWRRGVRLIALVYLGFFAGARSYPQPYRRSRPVNLAPSWRVVLLQSDCRTRPFAGRGEILRVLRQHRAQRHVDAAPDQHVQSTRLRWRQPLALARHVRRSAAVGLHPPPRASCGGPNRRHPGRNAPKSAGIRIL